MLDCEISYDSSYTDQLNAKISARYAGSPKREATHLSDLLGCTLKAWGKYHLPVEEWRQVEAEDDPILMWGQGLQFEELVSEGQKQRRAAWCLKCQAVSGVTVTLDGEQATCPVCSERWLLATPDYVVDGIIHESKQTRKSQRKGPMDAPWWIEQLAGYILFERRRGGDSAQMHEGRLVVNWIMGDYGEKRKGYRPRPPRSAIEAFVVRFPDTKEWWAEWEEELRRRKRIIEGDERPKLSFPGDEFVDSPKYSWECAGCPVGEPLGCENWLWGKEGRVHEPVEVSTKEGEAAEGKVVGGANNKVFVAE